MAYKAFLCLYWTILAHDPAWEVKTNSTTSHKLRSHCRWELYAPPWKLVGWLSWCWCCRDCKPRLNLVFIAQLEDIAYMKSMLARLPSLDRSMTVYIRDIVQGLTSCAYLIGCFWWCQFSWEALLRKCMIAELLRDDEAPTKVAHVLCWTIHTYMTCNDLSYPTKRQE